MRMARVSTCRCDIICRCGLLEMANHVSLSRSIHRIGRARPSRYLEEDNGASQRASKTHTCGVHTAIFLPSHSSRGSLPIYPLLLFDEDPGQQWQRAPRVFITVDFPSDGGKSFCTCSHEEEARAKKARWRNGEKTKEKKGE